MRRSSRSWSRRKPSARPIRSSDQPAPRMVPTSAGTHRALTIGLVDTAPLRAPRRPTLAESVKTLASNVKQDVRGRAISARRGTAAASGLCPPPPGAGLPRERDCSWEDRLLHWWSYDAALGGWSCPLAMADAAYPRMPTRVTAVRRIGTIRSPVCRGPAASSSIWSGCWRSPTRFRAPSPCCCSRSWTLTAWWRGSGRLVSTSCCASSRSGLHEEVPEPNLVTRLHGGRVRDRAARPWCGGGAGSARERLWSVRASPAASGDGLVEVGVVGALAVPGDREETAMQLFDRATRALDRAKLRWRASPRATRGLTEHRPAR